MATIDAYYFRVCTGGAERQGLDLTSHGEVAYHS